MPSPRLRGGHGGYDGPWDVGSLPDRVIYEMGKQFVHRMAIRDTDAAPDITGDDFGTIFANAIGGMHREKPIGLGDVTDNGTGWSVKTVKATKPHEATTVRLISGRCSPDYSYGISDPRKDPQKTGRAVLGIWNGRVNASLDEFDRMRLVVLLRNFDVQEFTVFEQPLRQFAADDYEWRTNTRGNLEGFNSEGVHRFTWQPHGAQFTIKRAVPGSARRFIITRTVPRHTPDAVLEWIGYRDDWIRFGESGI